MTSELFSQINYEKAYRKNRLEAAQWVLKHPETLNELVDYCFHDDKTLATKATWVLEFVFREQLSLIYPFLDEIFEKLPKATTDGQIRTFAYLCEVISIAYYKKEVPELKQILTTEHKQRMTECCFDWLISDQKVSCQARAMLALYHLGTETEWIHKELKTNITQNLPKGSAGYKNRGQKVVAMIAAQEGDQRNHSKI
ncbi:MAG: hypothetical protein R3359_08840 [Marinirhabdus sp.]|nr:hypothetical protein [Marinirhabdus sp.]